VASEPPVPAPLAPATPEPPRETDPVPAPAPAPAPAEDGQAAAPPTDGEQPTEVMRRPDGPTIDNGDADTEAVAQPTGEPREP
jgi:hypothetical protein